MNYKVCLLVLGVCGIGFSGALSVQPATGQEGDGGDRAAEGVEARTIEVQVVHKVTREPMADVDLTIRIIQKKQEAKTDAQGRCVIALGDKIPDYLSIVASKAGFVPLQVAWRSEDKSQTIPAQYTLALEPGTSIGGILRNEAGEPIAGGHVFLLVPGGDAFERVSIWNHMEKTDPNGRWRCDIVPAELDEVWIRLDHPDYISDSTYGSTPKPPMEQLRDMSGVMVMKRGLTVAGRVTDANDQPIAGATVAQGSDRFGSNYPKTKTEKDGRFRFRNAKPGEMILTVQATGYAPELKAVTVHPDLGPIDFRLGPGHTLKGRIVDTQGQPVVGAFVACDTWRGHRSLRWRVDTDAEGRFQWKDAPADEVLMDMGKQGYMSVRNHGLRASAEEYVITMPPELKIQGQVVDAQTGESIASFSLLTGVDWENGNAVHWNNRERKTFVEGHYEYVFSYPYPAHLLRLEADGYLPGVSRAFANDEGTVTYDFQLERGKGIEGIVRRPDGATVAQVEVFLCTPSQGVYLENGRAQRRRDCVVVVTKEDGRFSLPAQTDPFVLVCLHEYGFAEVNQEDLTDSADVTLQPWATVKGRLRVGKDPGVNETVLLGYDRPYRSGAPRFNFTYSTVTDSNGEFSFDRVIPGSGHLYRGIPLGERGIRYSSHDTAITTKAGETQEVSLGGKGRPVIGKVTVPEIIQSRFACERMEQRISIDAPDSPYRVLAAKFAADGSFRIDDVPAGQYCLTLTAYDPPADQRSFRGKEIGVASRPFQVPEMPTGRSDIPLDLGTFTIQAVGLLDQAAILAGKPLPAFQGMDINLDSGQTDGKPILMCFFDMEQRSSRHQVLQLVQQAEQLKRNNVTCVVVQISASDRETLDAWAKQTNLPYPIGIIATDIEKTRFTWGVKALPWMILTDKEHVVQAEGFSINELDEKLQQLSGD